MTYTIAGTAPILLLISFFLYIIWKAFYNLFLHPLAPFPGPKLNALSPLPGIISLLRGRLALTNKTLHDTYGPVVRVSPNELAFNSVQAWEDIYGHRPGHPNFHKDPIHVGSVEAVPGVTTLTMADDVNHARQRRALSHAFSRKALVGQEGLVGGYVDQLVERLKEKGEKGEGVNLVNWLNFCTFDIIGDLAFSSPFGCLTHGRFNAWVSLIFETVKAGAIEQATRRFATAGSLTQRVLFALIPSRIRGYRTQHLNQSREKCLQRLREGNDESRVDFISYILKQREKHDLKEDEIMVNSALFIVAGSETTANALSGLFARLIYNPEKFEKLVQEIRDAFPSPDSINYNALSALPYLNACIEEGLRIHPPVPQGLLRTVPARGDTIDGHWVPGGTSVAVGGWAASHSDENFVEADSFVPERWLATEKGGKYEGDKKKAMQPFSLGPRGCIGRHLSYLEMRLILGKLLWHFDVESTDGAWQWNPEGEMKNMRAFTTWEKPDLNVKVKLVRRENAEAE